MSWRELETALDAEERIPAVTQERTELVLCCYRTGHGPVSGADRERLAELASELSRLHGQLSDYYRDAAIRDREEADR